MEHKKQQHMQMPEETELLEPLRRMNLIDNFLFDVAGCSAFKKW